MISQALGDDIISKQAWAENAVIVSDDGRCVDYRTRCPYCGHVPTMSKTTGAYAPKGDFSSTSVVCQNCSKDFTVKLGRN